MKKKSAFTLIELLVVISIVAVLVALLAPAVLKFMERGRATECLNNLKSMGQGMNLYLSDNKGNMFTKEPEGQDTWPKILRRTYVKDWKSFRSPFDKVTSARPKREEGSVPISYGINERLFDTWEGKWTASRSKLILMAPALDGGQGKEVKFAPNAVSDQQLMIFVPGGAMKAMGTHSAREQINILCADFHMETVECIKYTDSTTEKGREQWDPMYEREER